MRVEELPGRWRGGEEDTAAVLRPPAAQPESVIGAGQRRVFSL
jgi:hypothetical protein